MPQRTYLINPRTNRRIMRGGRTHKRLMKRRRGGSSIFSFKRRKTRKPCKRVGFKCI